VTGARRRAVAVLWVVAPIAVVAALRPWTVRPLDSSKPVGFDAVTFGSAAWPRLAREAADTAVEVSAVAAPAGAGAPRARFVKGTGVVTAVDRQSRVGVLRVQLPGSGAPAVAIQIGPVLRGTALRDASSFIHFSDFTNQFDYAGAANALNDYALRHVVGVMPIDGLEGRTMAFTGAVGKSPLREDGAIEIVPIQLAVAEVVAK
jgi:predicted lipoprotein